MGTLWSVTPAVHYSAYFQGIMLAKLPSYNTEPFKRDIFFTFIQKLPWYFYHGTTF